MEWMFLYIWLWTVDTAGGSRKNTKLFPDILSEFYLFLLVYVKTRVGGGWWKLQIFITKI